MNAATLERPPVESEVLADGESENLANKTLAEFSQRQANIAAMQQRFASLVSLKSLSTPAEYESTRLAIAELRTFRGEVEKRKKVLNADAYAWIESVNSEVKRLIAAAKAIENPLQAMKDAADEEKERKRAELAEAQRKRLEAAAQAGKA